MKKLIISYLAFFVSNIVSGQSDKLEFNKEYKDIPLGVSVDNTFNLKLEKSSIYQFSILQQGIAAHIFLNNNFNNEAFESTIPEDIDGYVKFEYIPEETDNFYLIMSRFDDPQNPESGKISIYVKSLTKSEILTRQKIKKELEPENNKNVLTIDIDHFWEAFDNLKNCKSFKDSANSFQKFYLDRATDGLVDFERVRDLQSEKYVHLVARYSKFYKSLRQNTFKVKNSEKIIEDLFSKFKVIYSNFKPFKVCFAMGIMNTGGTVSNNFVLIGTEILTSTKELDLSEFDNNEYRKMFEGNDDFVHKIESIVAHECVHTQQPKQTDPNAIKCELLNRIMREGFCDFIAELVSGIKKTNEYGDAHEKQIWTDFKNELCNENSGNWLYNYSTVKDRPADLGYYVGYKIAEEYYKNALDKKQAVIDIIEMTNPIRFLELSKYDQKEKK